MFQMNAEVKFHVSDTIYCDAMDSINDKLIGCNRVVDVKKRPLLRPSHRIPYMMLCDMHRNRLAIHNCCPTCGIFCTEVSQIVQALLQYRNEKQKFCHFKGYFMECEAKHQHHKNCQITIDDRECCPHCGLSSSSSRNVYIEMQLSSRPTFLPVQTVIELVLITIISNLPSKTYPLFFICLLNIQYFFATFFHLL